MLKIEPRGYESKFWRYASPVLALLLTGATSGLIFAAMGRPPGLTVYTFLVAPLLQQDGFEALVVKAAPLIMMGVGLSLAYRANVWNIGTDGQFIDPATYLPLVGINGPPFDQLFTATEINEWAFCAALNVIPCSASSPAK